MRTETADGKRSVVQKLSDLVSWYLSDKQVQLTFVPNENRKGRLAPEYDFVYWVDGRRCTERALAMMIMTELQRLNYSYNLSKVISALTESAWRFYVSTQEYPDWLRDDLPAVIRRPVGRPRKHPVLCSPDDSINITP